MLIDLRVQGQPRGTVAGFSVGMGRDERVDGDLAAEERLDVGLDERVSGPASAESRRERTCVIAPGALSLMSPVSPLIPWWRPRRQLSFLKLP